MRYRIENGRRVCDKGTVVIEGMLHYVTGGYVYCAPELNKFAWNVTDAREICETCREKIEADTGQLELFS